MPDKHVQPDQVRSILSQYILADGLDITLDLEKSKGCYIHDSIKNRKILDFFTYFTTAPLGHNHPKLVSDEAFNESLHLAAIANPSNSDIYTIQYATFLETFNKMAMPEPFKHAFFIAGGAVAVENALKVAMDWKVQKNMENGSTKELGHKVIHFKQAFHGRSGYTLGITDTSPDKTRYFAKFDWPRITNPAIIFPLKDNMDEVIRLEQQAVKEIKNALTTFKDDICSIIIEPIQSEGGDNHFRKEFFQELRTIADENEVMLIFDEVQTGVAITGKFWAYQHFGVTPDLIAFGKKMQICGIISTGRVDEIPENCFNVSSRINSTWGGNLVDMVRSTKYLQIIEEDNLIENAATQGIYLLEQLHTLSNDFPLSNVRGLGLQCAFDLKDADTRNAVIHKALDHDLLLLGCGDRSIRFRPSLIITRDEIDEGMGKIRKTLDEILSSSGTAVAN